MKTRTSLTDQVKKRITYPTAPVLALPGPHAMTNGGQVPGFGRACGAWLFGLPWSHFVTYTTRREVSVERLMREFQSCVRRLEHSAQRAVEWAVFVEFLSGRHHPHLHALLGATSSIAVREVEQAWKLGNVRARVYDAKRGAAFYVSKHVLAAPDDWDVSCRLPASGDGREPLDVCRQPGTSQEPLGG